MSAAIFRVMLLGLVRDRGALAMSFLVPAAFLFIFAAIFTGPNGDGSGIKVAMVDEVGDDPTTRLLGALATQPGLTLVEGEQWSADEVRDLVRRGTADVGLIVRAGGEPLGSVSGFGAAPLIIVIDPARAAAASMLAGQVQQAYFSALPDVTLGSVAAVIEDNFVSFTDEQRVQLDQGIANLGNDAREGRQVGWALQDLFERERVVGGIGASRNLVAYYAGGIAMLFLLFSSVNGAITVLEEREAGILDRVLAGPGATSVLINGKFLYLFTQGFVQVGVIFLCAWLVYGVDLPGNLPLWVLTTLAASAAATGLTLALVTACHTRRRAQTLSNIVILLLSALGGSMVPRFLMPPMLQDLGWATPNAWALEAYATILWREGTVLELVVPWSVLATFGITGLVVARRLARRLESV